MTLNRKFNTGILIDEKTHGLGHYTTILRVVDVVRISHMSTNTHTQDRIVLSEPISQANITPDEWMYQLDGKISADPWVEHNAAWEFFLAGNNVSAQEKVTIALESSLSEQVHQSTIRRVLNEDENGTVYAIDV
jgi:hypothetical protein